MSEVQDVSDMLPCEVTGDPEFPEKFIAEFSEAIAQAHPFKPGMMLEVVDVGLIEVSGGRIVPTTTFKLPDGTLFSIDEAGEAFDPDWHVSTCQVELQRQTRLSPAGIRRRLRRLGILPSISHQPSEAD